MFVYTYILIVIIKKKYIYIYTNRHTHTHTRLCKAFRRLGLKLGVSLWLQDAGLG